MELTSSQYELSPEAAKILLRAINSGDPTHYHPEVEESHPRFDSDVNTLKLKELEKLFRTLEKEVQIQRDRLRAWEARIPWEKDTWTVTDAKILKHVRNLMTVEGKLDHLKADVKDLIIVKIANHYAYCLMQLGFRGEEIPQISRYFGRGLLEVIAGGFPAYQIGEA